MLSLLKEYSSDLFELFYPNICVACSHKLLKGESVVCHRCESDLPKTDHWNDIQNPLMKRFWGRVNLQGAAALYQFHKGNDVQHLLHQLKYRSREDIGKHVGIIAGNRIMQEDSIIKNIDVVIPVPLHWKKLRIRGYNQCDSFAKAIATELGISCSTGSIERVHENISQTKKNRFDRWGNVSEIFSIKNSEPLRGKHILLVDDVVTTGATAEACLSILLTVPDTKVSFVAMAFAMK